MNKIQKQTLLLFTLLAVVLAFTNCNDLAAEKIDVSPLSGERNLSEAFLKYYKPFSEDFTIDMPKYDLPVDMTRVSNLEKIQGRFLSNTEYIEALKQNGFVVIDGGRIDDITAPYTSLRNQDIPIYITADTPLHLFHIQFDETLKDIEEHYFYPDIVAATRFLLDASEKDYKAFKGDLKEAAKRNVAYFSVALKQFDPEASTPSYVDDWVEWECEKIEQHAGLPDYTIAREKSLFRVPEDYSQYKPRGHYTRSEELKQYFMGMMWFGRMTFLLKGHEKFGPIIPPSKALTDPGTAKLQTLQAALISARCGELKVADGRRISEVWDRIYAVTAFYAGFADDLTLYDYREAMREVFGTQFSPSDLNKEDKFTQLLFELSKLQGPAIFSGTGGAGIDPGSVEGHQFTSVEDLDSILSHTMGFRFMGQRYIPDSYILSQLVSPAVGTIPRVIPERFSVVYIPDERIQPDLAYSIRGFPRGLDVFSVFGSERAEELAADFTDNEYPKYDDQLRKLRDEFAKLTPEDWNRNLYWSWLYALKTLTGERGNGYQAYQQNDAWLDRQLNTALASWSALRHNTILYAKQSYTPIHVGITSARPTPPPPPPPKGLVEPLPDFYAKILTTTKMAYDGLKELEVLTPEAESRLASLVSTLERLYDICKNQCANKPLTIADNNFLGDFPDALKRAIGDVDDKGLKTTIIADVHTEMNTKQCLEEASGYVDYIVVAYARPEGDIVLAVGPVLSYYEFKHPMKDRLTDEKWREMLQSGETPEKPEWVKSFYK
ncbi:DUF3160 domain-containing protein [bacterium]|nr:DUF3160 domain-containing protein [bacterium]